MNCGKRQVVAELIAKVLTTPRPRARYVVGKDSRLLSVLVRSLPAPALDALRRKVFRLPAPGSRTADPAHNEVVG